RRTCKHVITKGSVNMSNFILFINSFLSYLLVMAVIVVLVGIAVFIGITMRKKKNLQLAAEVETTTAENE
ncbi:MAG: hypothetical protein IJ409_10215, partial [Lachnospiraceae bacterium]|nr:hypothetical protein [Lachnospiraceae bacterium]